MERNQTYAEIGFGQAMLEQFRLLWMSRRPLLFLAGLLGVLALGGDPWSDNPLARLFTPWFVWLFLGGPFWAFAVWHNEGPSNRLYMWSQPVGRAAHSMARLAAGALWLVLLYAVLLISGAIAAAFEGELSQFGMLDAAAWVCFFTAPLMAYLVISVLTIPSDYPIRWFLAFFFGVPIFMVLMIEGFGLDDEMETLFTPIIDEDWGLGVSMFAPLIATMFRLDRYVSGRATGGGAMGDAPDLELWWLTMPLWMLFWIGVVVLLATRHPDVFPRWRGRR